MLYEIRDPYRPREQFWNDTLDAQPGSWKKETNTFWITEENFMEHFNFVNISLYSEDSHLNCYTPEENSDYCLVKADIQ